MQKQCRGRLGQHDYLPSSNMRVSHAASSSGEDHGRKKAKMIAQGSFCLSESMAWTELGGSHPSASFIPSSVNKGYHLISMLIISFHCLQHLVERLQDILRRGDGDRWGFVLHKDALHHSVLDDGSVARGTVVP